MKRENFCKMIRKFQQGDTERVMQIWLEGNIETHDFIPKDYWVSNYPLVKKQLSQADIYVYEVDEKIQGFVGMMGDYIAGIFVDKNFRSMGIGTTLLEYIKGISSSFSLNVYQQNQRAVDFYLREGLLVVSEKLDEDTGKIDYTMLWDKNREKILI